MRPNVLQNNRGKTRGFYPIFPPYSALHGWKSKTLVAARRELIPSIEGEFSFCDLGSAELRREKSEK